MSETLTLETDGAPTRRSRAERPEREVHRETTVIEPAGDQISPEAASADVREQLQAKDREVAEARRIAREEQQRRVAAETTAAQATVARATDRASVVAAAIETAKSDETAATLAYRTAREAGDFEAEIAAQKMLNSAQYRMSQASSELEWLKANPPKAPEQPRDAAPTDERSRQWLADHPRYHTDEAYRSTAEGAHNSAVRANQQPGTEGYIRHIDRIMDQVYGAGHDTTGQGERREPVRDTRTERQPRGGDGVPPSRGNNGSGGGYRTINTLLGPVQMADRSDGTRSIRFVDAETQSRMEEGAKMDRNYEHDPRKALADYTAEQVQIALERAAGGTGDLVTGEGNRFE